jgi:NAD(P)-dependent dehydrogenase (short-subunit alcohol dehydrogenase family)
MSFELEGKKVVITGAARGIGLAIARRFGELGAKVSGWDLDDASMRDDPAFAHASVANVADEASCALAFASTIEAFGAVDIMVANAGINGPTKPAWEYSLKEWDQVLNVDLTGVFISTKPCVMHMRERGEGRLIFMASVAGKEGNAGACAYGAAKSGVIGYAKGLARELLPSNITVNCVAPAMTETELLKEMRSEYIEEKKAKIPMGRFCTSSDIADMTAFIASPRCAFTTGQVFDVTGGRATY